MYWIIFLLLVLAAWVLYAAIRPARKKRLYHGVNPPIVEFLTTELNRFPLHQAVFQNDFRAVSRLLKESPSLETETDDGQTPLHIAAECGLEAMCRFLLKRGANVNAVDNFGGTPLHAAAACQNGVKVIKLLACRGANLHLKDAAGMTPRALAEKYKHYKIAAYLKFRGA